MFDIKARVAELLLEELKKDKPRQWWYISMAKTKAEGGFRGGFFVKAMGPTDAWRLIHVLGWYEEGSETHTSGPWTDEELEGKVPHDKRWRKLTREEAENL